MLMQFMAPAHQLLIRSHFIWNNHRLTGDGVSNKTSVAGETTTTGIKFTVTDGTSSPTSGIPFFQYRWTNIDGVTDEDTTTEVAEVAGRFYY